MNGAIKKRAKEAKKELDKKYTQYTKNGLIQFMTNALSGMTDRQLIAAHLGVSVADTYKAPHANRGTVARKHKTRKQVQEHRMFSPYHANVATMSKRLFA